VGLVDETLDERLHGDTACFCLNSKFVGNGYYDLDWHEPLDTL